MSVQHSVINFGKPSNYLKQCLLVYLYYLFMLPGFSAGVHPARPQPGYRLRGQAQIQVHFCAFWRCSQAVIIA